MSRDVGAVVVSRDGYYAWMQSVLTPMHEWDDETCRVEPYFAREPAHAHIYSSARSAKRALVGMRKYTWEELEVMPLHEVS